MSPHTKPSVIRQISVWRHARLVFLAFFPGTVVSLLSFAAQAKELTVYSYFESSWGPGQAIEQGFEAQCSCDLVWRSFNDAGSILARLHLEKSQTKADVVLGLDQNLLPDALELDIWQEHALDESLDELVSSLPFSWNKLKASDTFLPYDYGWFAFVYRPARVPSPPRSLSELASSNLSVVIQDPRSSSPGLGLVTWVKRVFGSKAPQFWQQLKPNIVTVTPGWSEAYQLFLSDEADLVLSYTTSPAYHRIADQDHSYDWLPFTDGHYPQVEVMAITKSAKDVNLARQFLTYMTGIEAQQKIVANNWMFPVRPITLPDDFRNRPNPESLSLIDTEEIKTNRSLWIKEWSQTLSR